MSYTDFFAALPIEIVSIFALLVMLADAFVVRSTRLCATLSIVGLLAGIGAAVWTMLGDPVSGFNGMIRTGGAANVFDLIFCGAGIMTVLLARDYLTRVGGMFDEFYTLMMMSIVGMMLMAHASDFMVLFVGLEIMSICFYVMAGLTRGELPSNEASLKYFLLGAFASGFLLYGIALVYGALGTTAYADMPTNIVRSQFPTLLWAGVALLIVGLAFKVAAFPFHQWAPDVYTGAPTVVTSFMSTAGKAGAFAGFVGFMLPMLTSGAPGVEQARTVLALIAAGSMLIGNLTAIAQTNVKRMLAYSSIAHAGYLMIGLAAGNQTGATGILYYLGAYLFMQLGAFAVVGMLEREHGGNLSIDDYRGLGRRRPGMAIIMALFMFSLVGLPPFAGFFGKYYLFMAAIRADMLWLTIVGVISSVISAWFYLGLIVTMYFREPETDAAMPAVGTTSRMALALTIAGTLIVGLIPELIIRAAR
ncbi:MAG TPA: NADH-quinone oxidoreductase subunit N [Candidatus Kapabacteria bacterium]|jgi:NADH-quinone oxidoreductase subunit N|nr:NADH-quinone oxidoreductase subunit N [Candidatus Kapabacteria bacterium]